MALISWIVPRMLEACVQVTITVLSDRRPLRSDASSFGFSLVLGSHHLIVRLRRAAISTQEAILASWSIFDRINSEPGGNSRATDRLRKSWVVEEPSTFCLELVIVPI
jgi:hypothetical protein